MSAAPPPGPDELIDRFGLDPAEAEAIVQAMSPLQAVTSIGEEIGGAITEVDATGPAFVGIALQNVSKQVDLAATNVETLAKAIEFYLEAQTGSLEQLFPPPDQVVQQAGDDLMPLIDALNRVGSP